MENSIVSINPIPEKTQSPEAIAAEVQRKRLLWQETRRPNEVSWYINSAVLRNLVWIDYESRYNRIDVAKMPLERERTRSNINMVIPKYKSRQSKFLKNPFDPIVLPATSDPEDIQDARATKMALDYLMRAMNIEQKYKEALNWANTCSKGFFWFHWDPTKMARTVVTDPITEKEITQEFEGGDVDVEVGSPFEVLVADPGIPHLADQPEIMRVKLTKIVDVEKRYNLPPGSIKSTETAPTDFLYKRTIASLSPQGPNAGQEEDTKEGTHVLVIEWFVRPCGDYPKGRYVVVAGDRVLKDNPELPYGFHDMDNPYPVVEFPDLEVAGQYWNPTIIEQIIALNREYNIARTLVLDNIKAMSNPKIIYDVRHNFPEDSWQGGVAGEKIPIFYYPGIPAPQVIAPANIGSDVWQLIRLIKEEMSDIIQIYPESTGRAGSATSGFQTNLLQEANESVHAPDIRTHQLAMEDACRKMRRMMKLGYDVPRILAVVGKTTLPDVIEFSNDDIDEYADIIIWSGSALSSSPAIRNQQAMELFTAGILGNPQDPNVQRDTLAMIDMNGFGRLRERYMRDEEMARLENQRFQKGYPAAWPGPWEDHDVQYRVHTDQLKSPDLELWSDEAKQALLQHTIYHGYFIEPTQAMNMANEIGRSDLVQEIQQRFIAQQQIVAMAQQMMGPPQGDPNQQQPVQQPQQETGPPQG